MEFAVLMARLGRSLAGAAKAKKVHRRRMVMRRVEGIIMGDY